MRFLSLRSIRAGYSKNNTKFMMHSYSSKIIETRFLISRINNTIINKAIIFITDYSYAFFVIAH